MAKKIGVVLSGCGVYDGAEIHESVLTLLALDRRGAEAALCAPDAPQMHVVDHLSGQVERVASRNVLVESAGIASGAIRDVASVTADELDGVILPGGFGAAKNLCDFALVGGNFQVNSDVAQVIFEAHQAGKPIGFVCWGSQGSYGRFFNGRNSIDLSHKLVVLELKNLANREDLRNVVLMVLFYHMYRVIYVDDDRSKRKIIVFDEAHQFLWDPQVSRFVERLYRTLRKHAGSAITITQGLNDFYANEGTREILFQAAYWILLPQKQESLELLRSESKLSLSDYEFEQLTRLRTVKGQDSELFFFTPYGRGENIRRLSKEKQSTFVVIEHDMDVVLSLSDRIVVLHRGQILADGKPEQIKENEDVPKVYLGEELFWEKK